MRSPEKPVVRLAQSDRGRLLAMRGTRRTARTARRGADLGASPTVNCWSSKKPDACQGLFGPYGDSDTRELTKTFDLSAFMHTSVRIQTTLWGLGPAGSPGTVDLLRVDGQEVAHFVVGTDSAACAGALASSDAYDLCGYTAACQVAVDVAVPHSSDALVLVFRSDLDDDAAGRAWAVGPVVKVSVM